MKSKFIIILILLGVILQPLVAEITASYKPEVNIKFVRGNDLIIPVPIPASYTNETLVALLGTLTIEKPSNSITLKTPSLVNTSSDTEFTFNGPFEWNPGASYALWPEIDSFFYLDTATYIDGIENLTIRQSRGDGISPLTSPSQVQVNSSFTVLIFLRAHHSASKFKPSENYTHVKGDIGTFHFAVSPNNNIDDKKDYIPIGNNPGGGTNIPPATPTPILSDGVIKIDGEIEYDDDPQPIPVLNHDFSIINETQINLYQAYNSSTAKVADAQMTITNGISGETYATYISFASNSVNSGRFNLRLDGNQNIYKIPYDLIFNGTPVSPVVLGQDPNSTQKIFWNGIHYTDPTTVPIYVTGIDQNTAEQAPAGTYKDTITVNITSVDQV